MKYLFAFFLLIFTSCSSQKIESFQDKTPRLTFEDFFIGKVQGSGVFFDRFSNLRRSFVVEMEGSVNSDILTLKEVLKYDDGEIVNRTYEVTKYSDNFYKATADGVVGFAEIHSFGNALQWKYLLKQKIGKSEWTLRFDDWMYLQPTGVILNRAKVTKFGLNVGEVFMSIKRIE